MHGGIGQIKRQILRRFVLKSRIQLLKYPDIQLVPKFLLLPVSILVSPGVNNEALRDSMALLSYTKFQPVLSMPNPFEELATGLGQGFIPGKPKNC